MTILYSLCAGLEIVETGPVLPTGRSRGYCSNWGQGLCAREAQQEQQAAEGERWHGTQRGGPGAGGEKEMAAHPQNLNRIRRFLQAATVPRRARRRSGCGDLWRRRYRSQMLALKCMAQSGPSARAQLG